ncbi:uncharacterized protein LOC118778331 isoform X2 [Megalops cyprinoides]|uniref:uncharacterized protein LOC118778331 isoform X2 n=1 Tax=Megalops cyprinoides TaxID=118141 RepID=UPI001863A9D7|nr:uncharacterized protein LOC118778331 isoform X2 [Megalops cyprinoides]
MSCDSPEKNAMTPAKAVVDVCRVCGNDFASKKGKHNLLQGKDLSVRPDFTEALENLTGPVTAGDGQPMAVCDSCRTQLKRYHRCAAEVDRIGSAVKEQCSANVDLRRKRCAGNSPTVAPVRKQLKSCTTLHAKGISLPGNVSGSPTNSASNTVTLQVNSTLLTLQPSKQISARVGLVQPAVVLLPAVKQELSGDGLAIDSYQQPSSVKVPIPAITRTVPARPRQQQTVRELLASRNLKREGTVADSSKLNPQQAEDTKETKVILKTSSGMKTRVLRGPFEKIGEDLVQGRYKNLPRSIMAVPGLAYCVTNEVLKLVDKECKELTSKKFDSVLRQKTPSALADFTWDKVLKEWEQTAPNFLKFLECASTVSTQKGAKGQHKAADDTKKYTMAMAGVTLLRARSREMSAPMYHNSLVMHHGGAKKRCFRRLARLGICVSSRSTLHKLKQMSRSWDSQILEWKRDACKANTASENHAESSTAHTGSAEDPGKNNNRSLLDAGNLAIQTLLSEPGPPQRSTSQGNDAANSMQIIKDSMDHTVKLHSGKE